MPARRPTIELWHLELADSGERSDQWLSAAERARARAMLSRQARERFVAGRTLARRALATHLGLTDPGQVPLTEGARGRPGLVGGELRFSISHSGGRILVAIGDQDVGADIEQRRLGRVDAGLAERCATAGELGHGLDAWAFFWLWTAKEACAKCVGLGLGLDFRSFEVPRPWGSPVVRLVTASPHSVLSNLGVRWIDVGEGYAAAVASPGEQWDVQHREPPERGAW